MHTALRDLRQSIRAQEARYRKRLLEKRRQFNRQLAAYRAEMAAGGGEKRGRDEDAQNPGAAKEPKTTYRQEYPEVKVKDGITYTCILAKPGMPYVLLIGENHNIECKDSSRILSNPAVMHELLKDGDHFLLEDQAQNHYTITEKYLYTHRIDKLRKELKHCLSAKWIEGKTLSREAVTETCKYNTVNKKVQFHWLDYGMGWKDKLTDDLTGLHVIPQGIDKHKLDSDEEERNKVKRMIQNSLVHSLLDQDKPPCKDLGEHECLGYRNADFPGGACVFDNKGVEYQNETNWFDAILRSDKCRSIYDYIHNELHKPKCEGFQMPTPEALAEWFVSRVTDDNLTWQNFHIIRRIMDFYTLLRMFRKFVEPAKRCIVYAGADHSKALAKLLVDTQEYVIVDKQDPLQDLRSDRDTKSKESKELEDLRRDRDKKSKELEDFRLDREKKSKELEDLRRNRDKTYKELEDLRRNRDKKSKELEDLRRNSDKTSKELEDIRSDRENKFEMSSAMVQFRMAECEFRTAESKFPAVELKFQEAKLKFQTAESKFQTAESKFQTAESKFQTAESKFQTAEWKFQAAESKFQTAELKFQTAEWKFQAAESTFQAAESRFQMAGLKFQAAQAVEDEKFQQQANYCRVWTI